jgi:hypothetical protein
MEAIMRIRKQHLVILQGLAVSVAVLAASTFALSSLIRDAASTTPPAQARAADRAVPLEGASHKPGTPAIEAPADPLAIREAHSDGGYSYPLDSGRYPPADGGKSLNRSDSKQQ